MWLSIRVDKDGILAEAREVEDCKACDGSIHSIVTSVPVIIPTEMKKELGQLMIASQKELQTQALSNKVEHMSGINTLLKRQAARKAREAVEKSAPVTSPVSGI